MTAIEARQIKSALHASEYVVRGRNSNCFLIETGEADLQIGADCHSLTVRGLIWLPIGTQTRVRLSAGTRGWVLKIPELALASAIPHRTLGSYIREMVDSLAIFELERTADTKRLADLMAMMHMEASDNSLASQTALEHCLSLVLIEIWRMMGKDLTKPMPVPRSIVHSFMHMSSLHLRSHWTIDQYAKALGVPRDRLHSAVLNATGLSPKRYIHSLIMREAKALLEQPGLQVAEVAYKLGFTDAAYFNRFFQRFEGTSPGAYRKKALLLQDTGKASYAAWP